jgi:hypothetical protein
VELELGVLSILHIKSDDEIDTEGVKPHPVHHPIGGSFGVTWYT